MREVAGAAPDCGAAAGRGTGAGVGAGARRGRGAGGGIGDGVGVAKGAIGHCAQKHLPVKGYLVGEEDLATGTNNISGLFAGGGVNFVCVSNYL